MVSTLPDLPNDIIINILTRLPVKSLMRFRCVCISWHALVSDPNFINTHLTQTCPNIKGYVLIQHRSPYQYPFPSLWSVYAGTDTLSLHCDETFVEHMEPKPPLSKHFDVVGYCRGVLCLSRPGPRCRDHDIYLWNSSIQKFKVLPNSLLLGDSLVYLAFGFVPRTNDYKVLKLFRRIVNSANFGPPEFEIYSQCMNSWKRIQFFFFFFPKNICHASMDAVLNGVVHWVASKGSYYESILSFDMANEVFGEIKIPECCNDSSSRGMFVTVLKESLSLFRNWEVEGKKSVDVWVMKEYGVVESWIKQFTFDKWLYPSSFGFMKDGEVALRSRDGELSSYDPRVQQVKDIRFHGDPEFLLAFTFYMESLVLLNEGN